MLATTCLVAALAGCGQQGFLIKPVPLDQRLEETTVAKDAGWFITDKVVVVPLDGILVNERSESIFFMGDNPLSLFIEQLDKAQADPDVKAVVLRVNSPGGGVTASDIMYHRLMEFRAQRPGVPVITIIEDLGASGAYYVACGSDQIMAHPTAVVGSIGVLVQTFSIASTLDKIGVKTHAIISGRYKDMLSPLKPLDEKEAQIVQVIVDKLYGRFVEVVAAGRPKLTTEQVKSLADGRVFVADEAQTLGLIDCIGYMSDALEQARTTAAIRRMKVVMYHRPLGYKPNAYAIAHGADAQAANPAMQLNLINLSTPGLMSMARPQFMYMWTGQN